MKITKSQLKQVIKEELSSTLEEKAKTYTFTIDRGGKIIKVKKMGLTAAKRASKKLAKMHGKKAVTVQPPLDGLNEDGHEDTSSAIRKLKTSIEDASEILQGLQNHQGELPSWWMSKITLASDYLNKTRDYFLVSGDMIQEGGPAGHYIRKDKEEDAMDKIFGLTNNISSNILHLSKEDRALIERDLEEIRELAQMEDMLAEKIKKVDGGYYVTSKSGKHLSKKPHKTRKAALAQLGAVEASKAGRTK